MSNWGDWDGNINPDGGGEGDGAFWWNPEGWTFTFDSSDWETGGWEWHNFFNDDIDAGEFDIGNESWGYDPDGGGEGDGEYSDGQSSLGSPLSNYDDAMQGTSLQFKGKVGGVSHNPLEGFVAGIPPNAMTQQDFVAEAIEYRQNLDPNSFQYNTYRGDNNKTYQIPEIAIDVVTGEESTDIEDRIISLYNSFANADEVQFVMQRFGPDSLQDYLNLDDFSQLREYRQNASYIPQVINQSNETISLDGSTITFEDGTAFNTDLSGSFAGGVGTTYNDFYLSFLTDQVANYKAGNAWDLTSISSSEDGYDVDGFDAEGYNADGYNVYGYNREGFDDQDINRQGFNREGYNSDGFDIWGYDENGYDEDGLDLSGYDVDGYDYAGFDIDGYDSDGRDFLGFDREGYLTTGFDKQGYNSDGLDEEGFNRYGFNLEGYDRGGYDRFDYDAFGYDASGYDRFNRDVEGYDRDGYDIDGYDRDNIDSEGYNIEGLDIDGYDREGYDTAGYTPEGIDREGYNIDGYHTITGFDREGYNSDGVNFDGLTAQEIIDGYTVSEDGTLVLPEIVVTGTPDDTGNGNDDGLGLDGLGLDGSDLIGDGGGYGDGSVDLDGSGPGIVAEPDPNTLNILDVEKLNEIRNRFGGTRRAYNEFLQSDEGKEKAKNLGDFINDNLSPSGEFDMTKRAELFDKIALIATDGGFAGLNAFALGVNLVEGIVGTDLIDVPNVGYLIDNLTEKFLDDDLLSDIEKFVPDFFEKLTGIDQILQANSDPANGYLGQGFDFSAWLLGDLDMAREVDYGLRPATEQLRQQQEDYFREFLGDDVYESFIATTPIEDPNFFEKIIDFGQNTLGAVGDFAQDAGFLQQKYLGGTLPTNLLNVLGASSLGLPIGSIADMLGGAMAPSGQDLSDYLWANGIDPTTATRSDVGRFLVDRDYNIPGFNYETGEFEIQLDADGNEFNTDTDGDGFFDSFIENVSSLVGDDTVAGDIVGSINQGVTGNGGIIDTIIESGTAIAGGAVNEGIDLFDGATLGGLQNGNGADESTVTTVFEGGNNSDNGELDGSGLDAYGNPIVGDDGSSNDDGTGNSDVDVNDIITGTRDMGDIDENAYDAAYETAKFIIGASEAERFRGVGLRDEELQQIIGDYSSMVGESEAKRLLELNRIEQTGINELRDIQKGSDLDLLGSYGQEYADAVRGLDPTALGVLGQQEELSNRLYRRAAGDLTAEEEADAEERAFEIAAQSGRTLDSTRIANVIRAEEDTIANLEGRAQQAGTSTYNMSRGLTGNIPAMLLGNTGNPYGTGVGQVSPPLGIGDVVSMGTQQYAQQQNIAQAQAQLASVQRNYEAAIAANEPSKAQEFLAQANEITGYISMASQGLEFLGNAPENFNKLTNSIGNAWDGITTLFSGGSGGANYAYDPNSGFNLGYDTFNADDYLNTTSFGTSGNFDFGGF